MALRRVFVDRVAGGTATVRGPAAKHLASAARLQPGERVEVSDQVCAYRATTESCSPDEVRFRVDNPLPDPDPVPRLVAALSIIRFNRFEWAVEKLTELGVHSIRPLIADRCDRKLVANAPKRVARWRRIGFEAAQQARRLAAPRVDHPVAFEQLVQHPNSICVLADPDGDPLSHVYGGGGVTLLVGPEGGWTDRERSLAGANGFKLAGLGGTILRTETAAVAAAAICLARGATEHSR